MFNLSKQLTLKWFIFLLSLNFIGLQSKDLQSEDLQDIKIEDLHIFYILQNAKVVISQDVLEKDDSAKEVGANSLNLINKEIVLLEEIIDGLNKGHLMFIGYKFLQICNFFKDYDRIVPRDLRGFKKKLLKFDSEIQEYLTQKKESLSAVEVELCEKITDFNKMLLTCFLRYEFYGIDIFDRVIDTVIFRPFEWTKEHPFITLAFITLVVAVACYFYFYPSKFLKNKNPDIDGTQLNVAMKGQCTNIEYAVSIITAFHESRENPELACKLAEEKLARIHKEGWKGSNEYLNLLGYLRDYNESHQESPLPLLNARPSGQQDFTCFCFADRLEDDEFLNEILHIQQRREALKNGHSQYVILNIERAELGSDGQHLDQQPSGYWLPFMFVPDEQAKNGVRVFTADPQRINRTNNPLLNRLYHLFVHGD